jgi:transcription antitermination protein NusB
MTRRRRAREVALQLLFERDHNTRPDAAEIDRFIKGRLRDAELRVFCRSLYDGVVAHAEEIDRRLTESADNWRLPRMATVDRNALRLGAFELLFCAEMPPSVAMDEAIELARRYGGADSPGFVNGVLDRLLKEKVPAAVSEPEQPAVEALGPGTEEA